jgi:uncharacterized protein YukE
MADSRRVDIADLRSAGTQVAEEKAIWGGVHTETAGAVTSAQSGWVGSSAAAPSEVAARWHTVAQLRSAALDRHSGLIHGAADQFSCTEDANASAVAEVGALAPATA